jgi:hypothetical protein
MFSGGDPAEGRKDVDFLGQFERGSEIAKRMFSGYQNFPQCGFL